MKQYGESLQAQRTDPAVERRQRYEAAKTRERLADPVESYAALPRCGPDVVTTKGYGEPTEKQLVLIARLARQAGTKPPRVTTRGGASRAIERLRGRQHRRNPADPPT